MERGVSKLAILTELTRSSHSALQDYIPVGTQAATQEPEFFAHLIAYDGQNGSVRDAHIALPIISLSVADFRDSEFVDNSLAHLAKLSPRELFQAYKFAQGIVRDKATKVQNPNVEARKKTPMVPKGGWMSVIPGGLLAPVGRMKTLDRLVSRYLRHREDNPALFERSVMNFRGDMKNLYHLSRTRPSEYARTILHDRVRPCGSDLEALANLHRMDAKEAAVAVVEHRIPFLKLFPILGEKAKDPVLLMTIIDRMSPTDLQTQMANLEKMGVNEHPETRAALAEALEKLKTSKRTVLKTAKAADSVVSDKTREKLQAVQEQQIQNLAGIEGNWLVLGDRSGSMSGAIEVAKQIAGTLARFVKDQVALVFFDTDPTYYDVTGKTMEQIQAVTKHVRPGGSTSIGCGVLAAVERGLDIHGIALISDGEENHAPRFVDQYKTLVQSTGRQIPVYYYKVSGSDYGDSFRSSMQQAGLDVQFIDLRRVKVDSYSVPNLVGNMKVNRYSILDTVMATRLLTVESVLGVDKKGEMLVTA